MKVTFRDRGNRPIVDDIPPPLLDLTRNTVLNAFLLENGQRPEAPTVYIVSSGELGSALVQTDLDEFLTAGLEMMEIARDRWKWRRPSRFDQLLPHDRDAVKASLEKTRDWLQTITDELEEWED